MVVGAEDLVTVRQAARECGRTTETVRRWIWEGKLPARKLGNQLFIRRAELLRVASMLKGRDSDTLLAVLNETREVRARIASRIGGTLDILSTLDRSREVHP